MTESKFPTITVDLPSKGWFYPKEHPLSSGQLDMYLMTAKHEDILTSRNLIQKGTVIDKLLESLIATPNVKYGDLLLGDKNQLMVAARISGYGKDYSAVVECPKCKVEVDVTVDLEKIEDKVIPFPDVQRGRNEFTFKLPLLGKTVTFKCLTHKDEQDATKEVEALKKATKSEFTTDISTRMRYSILSVDNDRSSDAITQLIDIMPVRDNTALRDYARSVAPDLDMSFEFTCSECDHTEKMEVPVGVTFFWPDAGV